MDLSEQRRLHVDLDAVTNELDHRLAGAVSRERIEHLLLDLLASEFADARIAAYLPIFLQRAARERLQGELDHRQPQGGER